MDNKKFIDWARNECRIKIEENNDLSIPLTAVMTSFIRINEEFTKKGLTFEDYRDILTKLLYKRPLTPIDGDIIYWEQIDVKGNEEIWQCLRYPSLYMRERKIEGEVYNDYTDTNRYVCVNVNNPNQVWTGGIGKMVLDEMDPIIFPYMPAEQPIRIYMENFLYHKDKESVDNEFDTFAVLYFRYPDGTMKEVKRFFKITNDETIEIGQQEYAQRKLRVMNKEK